MEIEKQVRDALSRQSVYDWTHHLGDSRKLAERVLLSKLLNLKNKEVTALLADHLNIRSTN